MLDQTGIHFLDSSGTTSFFVLCQAAKNALTISAVLIYHILIKLYLHIVIYFIVYFIVHFHL